MSATLFLLHGGRDAATIRAQEAASVALRQGFRIRILDIETGPAPGLSLESGVLFLLAPPIATGLFGTAGAFWHQIVRLARSNLRGMAFSVLALDTQADTSPTPVAEELERALLRQQARRFYPCMRCLPGDEVAFRIWLCGALAAFKER
ncbi:MAG: hypothetical protein KIT22_04465 [Verrucomicrobiae bacterium]|nr:hypothetical protein [Verrucomicrobiae bacterium]